MARLDKITPRARGLRKVGLIWSVHLALAGPVHALSFPEEKLRAEWDRGCPDWPIALPGVNSTLAKNPAITIVKGDGVFRVYVKMTLSAELGESFASLQSSVQKLVMDGTPYPQWVLPGVNEKPGGGRYFVTVDGLVVNEREKNQHYALTGPYSFQILWFKRVGTTTIEVRHDSVSPPPCDLFKSVAKETPIDRVMYRMTPREDLVRLLMGELYFLPDPAKRSIELRMRLVTRPSNFVYQIMPEAMMRSELEVRGRRIFENLIELRRSLAFAKAATSVSETPSKKVSRPKRAR